MTDTPPAVALLFDDTELGGQLREALHERGARIVHEGEVSGLTRELLQRVGADVLVINLDDGADDALDQLYEVIDGDLPRVVFNDAQASRALVGWDRARWARHLAVKVLAIGDIDPPRPADAREIEALLVTPVPTDLVLDDAVENPEPINQDIFATTLELQETPALSDETGMVESDLDLSYDVQLTAESTVESGVETDLSTDMDVDLDFSAFDDLVAPTGEGHSAESEDLAAELEALLAFGGLPGDDEEEVAGPGLRFTGDEEPPPLHDGNFAVPEMSYADGVEDLTWPSEVVTVDVTTAAFDMDHLELSSITDTGVITEPADAAEPIPSLATAAVSAPDSWALLDDDAPADSDHTRDPSAFGIEKLSAAEFLAPDVEAVSPDVEPTMSLELVSMEEAIAPQAYVHDHEMLLDELGSALSRIVLLGASVDGTESLCQFLEALPSATRLTFLLTQHMGGHSEEQLLERYAGHGPLPMRMAGPGRRAGMGEVLMVPAGSQVRLRRDGTVELQADETAQPSIDASLTMAASAFGRDALAIVFAGRGNDAVAGSQAIHDRGGQVWVESSSGEHFADMVSGIFAERLVSFSGTPSELAAHLIEVFP